MQMIKRDPAGVQRRSLADTPPGVDQLMLTITPRPQRTTSVARDLRLHGFMVRDDSALGRWTTSLDAEGEDRDGGGRGWLYKNPKG